MQSGFHSLENILQGFFCPCLLMSMKAVVVQEYGDSSKLSYEDVPIPEPGPGEVRKND